MVGLAVLLVISAIGCVWTITVSKKNSTLKVVVREKEAAQHELQEAHDLLEERIKERTAQLKFQITARKESELQFKAVLTERTRLAQELHDTLEQSLTGIALQLEVYRPVRGTTWGHGRVGLSRDGLTEEPKDRSEWTSYAISTRDSGF
jgi:signal transduction histidine kinase